ncbi:Ubiquitin-conjugating enzyme E2 J1 [Pseudocercospora fuligena]|uniref:Ubiquitin-conjugating enzyme E2 J1 n=1 Tax=Pseudocercospora fuligena TaxID=685502 RepID=A0A8H6RGH0_9PEZI|nr:Ubiquitin-conjugating enzyme E2 J1 [Pseudocercospora fuligena]
MGTKSPSVRRIMKEAAEFANQPSSDFTAAPLESDLFEWHFTLRGPPAPSPFDGGIYHGRIVLPPAYPLKPPSFRFLTPTGRFEVNREICLSISGHHEETWQPAWGIRTALVAIRSFMDTDAKGQLGGMDASDEVRKRFAGQSKASKCHTCGKTNEQIMAEQEELVKEAGGEKKQEEVPEELRLAYREDLSKDKSAEKTEQSASEPTAVPSPATVSTEVRQRNPAQAAEPASATASTATLQSPQPIAPQSIATAPVQQQQRPRPPPQDDALLPYIDKAIYGILAAIIILIYKKLVV